MGPNYYLSQKLFETTSNILLELFDGKNSRTNVIPCTRNTKVLIDNGKQRKKKEWCKNSFIFMQRGIVTVVHAFVNVLSKLNEDKYLKQMNTPL